MKKKISIIVLTLLLAVSSSLVITTKQQAKAQSNLAVTGIVFSTQWNALLVDFGTSTANATDDTSSLHPAQSAKMSMKKADGSPLEIWAVYLLGTNMGLFIKDNGAGYTQATGDVLTLKKDLTFLEGEVLAEDVSYEFDGSVWIKSVPTTSQLAVVGISINPDWKLPFVDFGTTTTNTANDQTSFHIAQCNKMSMINADGTPINIWAIYYFGSSMGLFTRVTDSSPNHTYVGGEILTIKKGLTFLEGEVLAEEVSYIFNGTAWVKYVAATDITITNPDISIAVGATAQISATVNEGATSQIAYKSNDELIATVDANGLITAVKEGTTTITLTSGTAVKTVNVTITKPLTITGVELVSPYVKYHVLKGETIDVTTIKAKKIFNDGSKSAEFALTATNATITLDTATVGEKKATVKVTIDGKEYSSEIDAKVYAPVELEFDFVGEDPSWHTLCFRTNSTNTTQNIFNIHNIISDFTSQFTISRENALNGIHCFGQNICLFYANPIVKGDIVTMKKGSKVYEWTGALSGDNKPTGAGQYIVNGITKNEKKVIYNGTAWVDYVEATDIIITNPEISIAVEATAQINAKVNEGSTAMITYKSNDELIATVDANGLITAIKEGTTTITLTSGTIVKTVNVTIMKKLVLTNVVAVSPYVKYYVLKGETIDVTTIKAQKIFDDGSKSAEFALTATNATITLDTATVGEKKATVKVTIDGKEYSSEIDIKVYSPVELEFEDIAWNVPWSALGVRTNTTNAIQNLFNIENTFPEIKNQFVYSRENVLNGINCLGQTMMLYFEKPAELGDVLIIKKGTKVYEWTGALASGNNAPTGVGQYIINGVTKVEKKVVYNGKAWIDYVGEPTSLVIDEGDALTIATGSERQLNITFTPEKTYGHLTYISSDPTVAKVSSTGLITALKEGTTTITASISETVKDVITITVKRGVITGIDLNKKYEFHILKDEKFVLPELKGRIAYEGGFYGAYFDLVIDQNVTFTAPDTSVPGGKEVTLKITVDEIKYDVIIDVIVYELYDQLPSQVGIVDWFNYTIFVQFPNTSSNMGNITDGTMTSGVLDHIIYKRADGKVENVTGYYILGANLVIMPEFLDSKINADNYNTYYKAGDELTLLKGLKMWKWTGKLTGGEANALDIGTGEVIVEGEVVENLVYRYNGNVWSIFIEYTDISAKAPAKTIKIDESSSAGVTRVPSNATAGTITYKSSDSSIVTVSDKGVLKGIKAGKATITATIDGGSAGIKTVTIEVTVEDYVKGIVFNKELINTTLGADLSFKDIIAKLSWASGKEGDVVDLSKVTITGFDKNVAGEQTVIISTQIDGKTVSGSIKVNVEKKGCGKGCNSANTASALGFMTLLCAGILITKKR